MLNYNKPAFWVVVVAIVICIVVAVCFLTNPRADDSAVAPFGRNYSVEDIIYESGTYSFSYTTETAPDYYITADKELLILEDKSSDNWLDAGMFESVKLTKDNFDRYFRNTKGSASSLRRNNSEAWRLLVSDLPDTVFYYLLIQDNGDIFLTYGYYDASEIDEYYSDDSSIRWVFKLTPEETIGETDSEPDVESPATQWFDCFHDEEMIWGGAKEISIDAYPGITFRWHSEKVEAVTDTEVIQLYTGMPVWSVFFCDLTGDGKPELCSTVSFGSGIVDNRIIVYNYEEKQSYELSARMEYDYSLYLHDGGLHVEKWACMSDELLEVGTLVFRDGHIEMSTDTSVVSTVGTAELKGLTLHVAYTWVDTAMAGWFILAAVDKGQLKAVH